jgi:hypothetical protein
MTTPTATAASTTTVSVAPHAVQTTAADQSARESLSDLLGALEEAYQKGLLTAEEHKEQRMKMLDGWRGYVTSKVHLETVAAANPGTDMVMALREQHALARDQWRNNRDAALTLILGFEKDYADKDHWLASLRETYEGRVGDDKFPLSSFEKVVLTYLLYPKKNDLVFSSYFLASMLLNVTNDKQLALHNWAIAEQMSHGKREALGSNIDRIQVPLLSEDSQKLRNLNHRMLNNGPVQAIGGGSRCRLADIVEDPSGAGYLLPVTDLTTGQHVGNADMGVVEEAMGSVVQQIQALQANLATLQQTQAQLVAAQRPGQQAVARATPANGYQQQRRPRPSQQQPQQFQQRPQSMPQFQQHQQQQTQQYQQQYGLVGQQQPNGRGRNRARGGEAPGF